MHKLIQGVAKERSPIPADFENEQLAIFAAASIADGMAAHLGESWHRNGSVDVVSRAEADAVVRKLDRLFAIEAQRQAAFLMDDLDDEDPFALETITEIDEIALAVAKVFTDPDIQIVASLCNHTDLELSRALQYGLAAIDWREEGRGKRTLRIVPNGGKLPVAYLSNVFATAEVRIQHLAVKRVGAPVVLAKEIARSVKRSVLVEALRAAILAGESLATLASWCLTMEEIDIDFLVRLKARGSYLFTLALLAAATKQEETALRDAVWSGNEAKLDELIGGLGLPKGTGAFLIGAMRQSRSFGRVSTAEEMAEFLDRFGGWLEGDALEADECPGLAQAILAAPEWTPWSPTFIAEQKAEMKTEVVNLADWRGTR